jgi:hypothetical protein
LGERLLCKQEVIGSIPFTSTTGHRPGARTTGHRRHGGHLPGGLTASGWLAWLVVGRATRGEAVKF